MAEGLSKNQLAARAELEDLAQELKEPTPAISMLPFSVPAPQPARIVITASTDMAQVNRTSFLPQFQSPLLRRGPS